MTQHRRLSTVGLITYHSPHLKTEQVLQQLLLRPYDYRLYALPFKPRRNRVSLFPHRPEQADAVAPEVMAAKHKLPYAVCASDAEIDDLCDIYLVLGASILSPECVATKRIINCHPGIIPASRGLDSFKWAIYELKPLGVTLHYIDREVDAGEIIAVESTNVYASDSLASLARRHYDNELSCLARFEEYLESPRNPFAGIAPGEARMRMPAQKEGELASRFADYTAQYGK